MAIKDANLEKISLTSPEQEKQINLEKKIEQKTEKIEKKAEDIKDKDKVPAPPVTPGPSALVSDSSYEEKQVEAIENIMAEGMDQVFLKMNPAQQKKFKTEGEKTAKKINQLMMKAKISAEKIVLLIRRWLSLVPRINRFFLEQEAKIKADKILKIKKSL
jgi:hypothetical protein